MKFRHRCSSWFGKLLVFVPLSDENVMLANGELQGWSSRIGGHQQGRKVFI